MAKNFDPTALTAQQQIAVLKTLKQQAAAHLVGLTARVLRDHVDAPRDDDGLYDACALTEWAGLRVGQRALDDDAFESLLLIAEQTIPSGCIFEAARRVQSIRDDYGQRGLLAIAEMLVERWIVEADETNPLTKTEAQEIDGYIKRATESAIHSFAHRNLRVVSVCEVCEKLRHGRRWIKAAPPSGYVVMHDICPACESG